MARTPLIFLVQVFLAADKPKQKKANGSANGHSDTHGARYDSTAPLLGFDNCVPVVTESARAHSYYSARRHSSFRNTIWLTVYTFCCTILAARVYLRAFCVFLFFKAQRILL